MKLVWLGAAFLSEEFHELIYAVPLSLRPVHALCYSACSTPSNRMVAAISEEEGGDKCVSAARQPWPLYRTSRPNGNQGESLRWSYSEASLESVNGFNCALVMDCVLASVYNIRSMIGL